MGAGARTILHADMDAFYASIEQRDHPALRGRPVIVGGSGRRGVVATASYEARRFGVHSAMPGAIARRKCPDGVFVRPRMEHYAAVAAQVRAVFERYTPVVEPLSLDEAFLDVTESRALYGDGRQIAHSIIAGVRAATALTVSVGVAATKFVAKVASDLDKPGGLVVVPAGTEAEFLAPLPVARLWGAGPVTQRAMAKAGLHRIGDLQELDLERLTALFGNAGGVHYHALSRGVDPRRVEPSREARSVSSETTFEHDIHDLEECHRVLLRLSEDVGRRLRKSGLRGGVVRIKVRYPPFETHTRQCKLPAPVDDDASIYAAAVALFARARPNPRPVRLLGVGVAALFDRGEPVQRGLFEARDRRVDGAVDAIRDRFGDGAIRRGGAD